MYEPMFVHIRPKIIFVLVRIDFFTVITALQIRMNFHLHKASQNSFGNLGYFAFTDLD